MWSDEVLIAAARLLRRFHDATIGYAPLPGATWQLTYPDRKQHEVICHNDFAPYNVLFVDGLPRALIDFDNAGPGPRLWDIAYAVFTFVPLSEEAPSGSRGRRLRLFCDTYGLEQRLDLLSMVERRLEVLCTTVLERAAAGDRAWQRLLEEGHLDYYRRCIVFIQRHISEWQQAL
jgi:Ser/Thr protein kinase RdoA (MazF antagonist)